MNWKRILLIIGILLGTVLIIFVLYAVFFAPKAPPVSIRPTPTPTPPPATGAFPPSGVTPPAINAPVTPPPSGPTPSPVAKGGITQTNSTVSTPVSFSIVANNGNLNYYDPTKKQFFKVTPSGSQLLSDKTFPDVQATTWSPDGSQAILQFPDGSKILYNFSTQEQASLPKHWDGFTFSPSGDQIGFKSNGVDTDNRWLAVASPTGDGVKLIDPLGDNGDTLNVDWAPNNQVIATFTQNIGVDRSELFFVGFNDENFKSTTLEGTGYIGQWDPKGDRLLYSVHSTDTNDIPELWVVDAVGNDIGNGKKLIGLPTFADKCVFSQDNVTAYCAVPTSLPTGAGIFRPAVADVPDNFYRVNTVTGAYELIAKPATDTTAMHLQLAKDENTLYFTDTKNNLLEQIKIK